MRIRLRAAVMIAVLDGLVLGSPGRADDTPRRIAARAWFEDARLGLSVRWGIYALAGKGERVMERDRLPAAEYDKLASLFNPGSFHADEWVKAAKASGARYLVFSAKDVDGFSMFDSALTRFDIVDATPFAKDPLRLVADACRKHGIRLFVAYSLLDWHHPDYFPRGLTGRANGRRDAGDWSKYVAFYQGQIRELCTNYGDLAGIRLEGMPDRPDAAWDLAGTLAMIRDLQPGALVAIDHAGESSAGEDFRVAEPEATVDATGRPAVEVAMSVNKSRGFTAIDRDFKPGDALIRATVRAAGNGSNLLLNVGARPDGTLPPEATERLRELGRWLDKNGASIYETRRGQVAPGAWGVSTRRGMLTYLHVLKGDGAIVLPKPDEGSQFDTMEGVKLAATPTAKAIEILIPEAARTPIDTIIMMRPLVDSSPKR